VIRFITRYRKELEIIQPSFFEWTWGLASDYFSREQVDIAMLETGMGGRLDSTNVVTPELSVITNIGYDHMQFLGDTLSKIASEKAGIIKPGIAAVIGETHPETASVFIQKAKETESPVYFADANYHVLHHEFAGRMNPILRIWVENKADQTTRVFESPLTGLYQLKNIVTVLQSIEVLQSSGYRITDDHIKSGISRVLRNTYLKGRWQVIGRLPLTVADIGHNKDGIKEVLRQIEVMPHDQLRIVLGVVNDKDVDAMLSLLPLIAKYYFCKADIPRGLDVSILREKANKKGLAGNAYNTVCEALKAARNESGKNDLVVVTGSAFVVAEAI